MTVTITSTLKSLGFSDKEVVVLLAASELGPATAGQIAQKTGYPRSSTYLVIESLKKMGLISQYKFEKKSLFSASSPDRLFDIASQKTTEVNQSLASLKESLPKLQALHNQQPRKPDIRFYEGLEGLKTILEDTLSAGEILVTCSGYSQPLEKKLAAYLRIYFEKIEKKKIRTREILGKSPNLQNYITTYSGSTHHYCPAPFPDSLEHIDKLLYADKLALISYTRLNGVVIQNDPMITFEKILFENLWRSLM